MLAAGWPVVAGVAVAAVPPVAVGAPVGAPVGVTPPEVGAAVGAALPQAAISTALAKSMAIADLVTESPFRHTTLANAPPPALSDATAGLVAQRQIDQPGAELTFQRCNQLAVVGNAQAQLHALAASRAGRNVEHHGRVTGMLVNDLAQRRESAQQLLLVGSTEPDMERLTRRRAQRPRGGFGERS